MRCTAGWSIALLHVLTEAYAYTLPESHSEAFQLDSNVESPKDIVKRAGARPQLGSIPDGGSIIWSCTVPGTVALTFDDGPSNMTIDLLNILASNDVRATFFVCGNNNGKGAINGAGSPWPDVIRRTYNAGHQIGSHSWTHPYFDQISSQQRIDEMTMNEEGLSDILGFYPTYMRPPYSFCGTACLADMGNLGYHVINYNLDSNDWRNPTPDLIQNSKNDVAASFANTSPKVDNRLILSHDTHPQTVYNLTQFVIDTVRSKGFSFVTVGECLNDPAENWYRDPATGGRASITAVGALTTITTSSSSSSPPSTTVSAVATTSSKASTTVSLAAASVSSSSHSATSSAPSAATTVSDGKSSTTSTSRTTSSQPATSTPAQTSSTNGSSHAPSNLSLCVAICALVGMTFI